MTENQPENKPKKPLEPRKFPRAWYRERRAFNIIIETDNPERFIDLIKNGLVGDEKLIDYSITDVSAPSVM